MIKSILLIAALLVAVQAKVYLHETFDAGLKHWTTTSSSGKVDVTAGTTYGDAVINKGLTTTKDAQFYATSRHLEFPVPSSTGKTYAVGFTLKHEQSLECGGGYLKFLYSFEADKFNGETPYHLMFGPDKCGPSNRVHIIFNYRGRNIEWKKFVEFPLDKKTHAYVLVVRPDNTYALYVDQRQKEGGALEEDWDFLAPREVDDPADVKPADWADEPMVADPADAKPADWDSEPRQVPDPKAKRPEDWDDEEDGKWEAPMVPNPKHRGEWKPKQIENPKYKGEWKPRQVPNPKYEPDANLHAIPRPITQVGLDVWQVQSGSIFDNIIVADTLEEVNTLLADTWATTRDREDVAIASMEEKEKKDAVAEDDKKEKEEEELNKKIDADAGSTDATSEATEDEKQDL